MVPPGGGEVKMPSEAETTYLEHMQRGGHPPVGLPRQAKEKYNIVVSWFEERLGCDELLARP